MRETDFQYSGIVGTKVACHMGDHMSDAACNLIGDQPLFYYDNIDASEDEFLVSDEFFDDHVAKLQQKLDAYEKTASILSNITISSPNNSPDVSMNFDQINEISIDAILSYGQKSATFQSYKDFIDQYEVSLEISANVQSTFFNKEKNTIFINPYLDIITATVSFLKTMRTVWVMKQGIMINPLSFQPEEAVLVNRLFMADLDVVQCAFYWDLKLSGDEKAWARAMGSSDYDLYTAYAIEAMTDFRAIKSGLAARAAFEKWFLSDRCRFYDRQIIQTMLGRYADIEIEDTNTSRMVAKDIILRLGHRPIGKNYLSSLIANILYDELYSEVRDRSNANFLWFITFEKRMTELEQHLQSDDDHSQSDTKESSNNVHHLQNYHTQSVNQDNTGPSATLFFLDHFRAGS